MVDALPPDGVNVCVVIDQLTEPAVELDCWELYVPFVYFQYQVVVVLGTEHETVAEPPPADNPLPIETVGVPYVTFVPVVPEVFLYFVGFELFGYFVTATMVTVI
jgi:hypothetical protein